MIKATKQWKLKLQPRNVAETGQIKKRKSFLCSLLLSGTIVNATVLSFKETFSYFFVEIFVGFMYKSLALVADACHMLSDGLCLVIAFIAIQGKLPLNTIKLLDWKIFQFQNDHQINVF